MPVPFKPPKRQNILNNNGTENTFENIFSPDGYQPFQLHKQIDIWRLWPQAIVNKLAYRIIEDETGKCFKILCKYFFL